MLSYEEFVKRLKEIKEMGWIKTHRTGPTGIGKTLEDLLGIKENNIAGPDHEKFELKSTRKHTTSMLTLFTKSPLPRGVNSQLLQRFGYPSRTRANGQKELHTTIKASEFNTILGQQGFKVEVRNNRLYLLSAESNEELAYWEKETLKERFEAKYPGLMYVKTSSRGRGSSEEFLFDEAYLLEDFSFKNFISLIEQSVIVTDIRIGQYPDGRPHDHGTGFRVQQNKLDSCFSKRKKII